MVTPQIEIIDRALALVGEGALGQPHSLATVFGRLGGEVQVRAAVLEQSNANPGELAKLTPLKRLFRYVALREMDLFARLSTIDYLRGVFTEREGDEAIPWHTVAALAIKDFHIDVSALMDSIAPVAIQATVGLKTKDLQKLPAFPDIQEGTKRSYRDKLPDRVRDTIDSTNRWWPATKRLRDILAHREHEKIAFGHASDGVLFQLYEPPIDPLVVHPAFLVAGGHNVAEFGRYSANLLAEVFVFMDSLGRELCDVLGWNVDGLNQSMFCANLAAFQEGLHAIRESLAGANPAG